MAEETVVKILDIRTNYKDVLEQLASLQGGMRDLKDEQKSYKEQLDSNKISQKEYDMLMEASKQAVAEQSNAISTLQRQMRLQIASDRDTSKSINDMTKDVNLLRQKYMELSETERKSAAGRELLEKIVEQDKALQNAREEMDVYRKSTGLLMTSIQSAIGPTDKFTRGALLLATNFSTLDKMTSRVKTQIMAFGNSLKSLVTENPYLLALIGLVGVAKGVQWWYEYNKGLIEATRLTKEFNVSMENSIGGVENVRNSVSAIAEVNGKDFKEVLTAADVLVGQYGVKWEEALGIIKKGFEAGADMNGDFLQKLSNVAPRMRDAGVAAEDLVGMINQTRSGIFSDEGMGAISMATRMLSKGGKELSESLKGVGVDLNALKASGASTVEIVQASVGAMNKLGLESDKSQRALNALFGRAWLGAGKEQLKQLNDISFNLDEQIKQEGELAEYKQRTMEAQERVNNALSAMFDNNEALESMKLEFTALGKEALAYVLEQMLYLYNAFVQVWNESEGVRKVFGLLFAAAKVGLNNTVTGWKMVWERLKEVVYAAELVLDVFNNLFNLNFSKMGEQWDRFQKRMTDSAKKIISLKNSIVKDSVDIITDTMNKTVNTKMEKKNGSSTKNKSDKENNATTSSSIGGSTSSQQVADNNYQQRVKAAKAELKAAEAELERLKKDSTATTEQVDAAFKRVEEAKKAVGGLHVNDKKGGSGSKDDKTAKEREAEEKALKQSYNEYEKVIREGEAMLRQLIGDEMEKRRAEVRAKYDAQVADLEKNIEAQQEKIAELEKKKAKTSDPTVKASIDEEIANANKIISEYQKQISLVDKLEQQELEKLSQEQVENDIKREEERLRARLEIVKKGSQEELRLRLDLLKKLRDEELNSLKMTNEQRQELMKGNYDVLNQLTDNEREKGLLILEKYKKQEQELNEESQVKTNAQQRMVLENEAKAADVQLKEYQARHSRNEEEQNAYLERQLSYMDKYTAERLRKEREAAMVELQQIQEQGQLSTETAEEYNARYLAAKEKVASAEIAIDTETQRVDEAKYQSAQSLMKGTMDIMNALGEENKELAKASKVIALAQIAIDTGVALAKGIKSASDIPFPGNLASIAATVATVLANIATAISTVKSAKFAKGGKVEGAGTGTSDSIPAMLSNGEFVVNARSTAMFEPFLRAINGFGQGVPIPHDGAYQQESRNDSLAEAYERAAQNIRPVVSVVDINDGQNRVNVIDNLDSF